MTNPKLFRTLILSGVLLLGGWIFLHCLGPVLLPFFLGLVIALSAEPAADRIHRRFRLPRWLCAGISVSCVYLSLSLAVFILFRLLWQEAEDFFQSLPELTRSLSEPITAIKAQLLRLAGQFPPGLETVLTESIRDFFRSGAGLVTRAYNWVFSFATAFLKKLPDLALFLLTAVLSGFMLSSELPTLRSFWQNKAPPPWQRRVRTLLRRLKVTLGGWCKAQCKLMLISSLLLTAGFLLLGIDYPLLLGLGIALVDALPALGTGLILIPWGLLMFLQGRSFLGTGLLCLYGLAALLRTTLEPRMLGRQIGLSPILTLFSLYTGYRFLGLIGMILFPIAAIMIKQYWNYIDTEASS